jgi:SHS2 domain-containing protein
LFFILPSSTVDNTGANTNRFEAGIHTAIPPGESAGNPDMWQHFDHQADIGVHGSGPALAAAFEEAALALTAVVTDPEAVIAEIPVEMECRAPDPGLLLVDWLNAVIYEMATRRMLFREYSVRIEGNHLQATARGEPVDVARHQPAAEPKGATFTALSVHEDTDGTWHAQCVVDV